MKFIESVYKAAPRACEGGVTMNNEIKILEKRIAVLERRVAELLAKSGIEGSALDEYEYQEAIEHMTATGDPSLINAHLRKVNSRSA